MTPGPFVSCFNHKLDMKDANGVIIESANPLALSKHNTNLKVKFIIATCNANRIFFLLHLFIKSKSGKFFIFLRFINIDQTSLVTNAFMKT